MLKAQSERRCCVDPGASGHWRRQVALAANGNGPAQRAVIEMVQAIERELALVAAAEAPEAKAKKWPMADRDLARRIAWILSTGVPNPGRGGRDRQTIPGASEAIARLRSADVAGLPERRTQWPRGRRLDQNGPRCGNNGFGWARARGHSCAAWWHEESRAPVGAAHGGRATTLFSDLPMT